MHSYKLLLSRTSTQIWFLILYPILTCVLFYGCLVMFGDFFTNEDLILPTIITFMVMLIVTSVIIVRRYLIIPATITVDDTKLTITLAKRNMFYHFDKITCGWDNVKNASKNFEAKTKRDFINISLKKPGGTLVLAGVSKEEDAQLEGLWDKLDYAIKNYNKSVPQELQVMKRGLYSSPFMRLLAYFGITMLITFGVILIYSPEFRKTENILKLLAFVAFLIPFLINYFAARKREGEENNRK